MSTRAEPTDSSPRAASSQSIESSSRSASEKEKQHGCRGSEPERAINYEPIRVETNTSRRTDLTRSQSLRSIHSQRSYGGYDGYSCFSDEEAQHGSSGDADAGQEKDEYLVAWDGGDKDPGNPRMAPNMATMLVSRFVDGLAGSAFLSVAGGTVGDLFAKHELSAPMMFYTASPFIGPEVGPLIGGFINQYTNWRWSFYVLLIWAGVQLGLIVFLVPETYHPVLLRQRARQLRKETGNDAWHAPIEKLTRSLTHTLLWSCREAQGGEPGGSEPEFRLPPTIVGAILVPIGLFGFGWTTFSWVHWIVPILFSLVFGVGTIFVFAGVFTFLVDCYPLYAASALAANSFARSSFAAAFPLFGVQMYNKLGDQWATSLLAFLALAMAP
ncbi:hypothetical protein H2199_005892 [Coniosporium tulheliwenetii]|uniref:Uncharacterized protein n=1 Tax=Coniosporium tulheliwenetii TaxID=3383036 RepID=A0ACC2YY45_9PEZI|nr:hypothetical protein H2199_005892 [Cladosporium sp. JES 115]